MRGRPAGTLAIATAVAGLAGCVSLPPAQERDSGACETPVDADGDGYAACGVARVDCDDGAAEIHPGARERCEDGVDQDCSGGPDLACDDALTGNTTSGVDVWTVSNEALAITFDRGPSADGLTGPISLTSRRGADAQLLVTDPRAMDRYAAVTRWPTVFSWRSADAAPSFTELASGDAVVQVRSTWADGGGGGSTTFTIYPDGRVHRHDEVTVPASTDQYLATYVAFDPARVDHADWDGAAAPEPLDLTGLAYESHYEGTSAAYACVFDATSGDRVLFAARPQAAADGVRVSEADRGGAHVAGLSFDWQRGGDVAAGDYAADTLWHVGHGSGARPCPEVGAFATAFRQPPAIAVDAPGAVTGGDADGYHEVSGAYEVSAGGATALAVTLAAAVPSLALRVVDGPGTHDPVVLRDGAPLVRGRDYHLQRDDDAVWLLVAGGVGTGGLRVEWP